jgi:protein required for attachment to host cells
MTHWILIADASDARIFSITGRVEPLQLVREITNKDGRMRTQDLVSDEPGRTASPGAAGTRSAMDPKTSAHEDAANTFVRALADQLHHDLARKAYSSLSLVAPAHMLGQLREALHKDVAHQVRSSLAKDLTNVPAGELLPHVEPLLIPGLFGS